MAPHAIGKDHPEGVIAGVHSNYYFTFPAGNRWPANKTFVEKYFKRWNEYPNFQSDGAYHTLHMYKTAIEKANKLVGGWPDEEAVISQLEGMYFETAAGYLYIRPDNHQGYKDAVTGFSKNVDQYQFQILDPRAHDHHPDPQHHRASGLAEAGQRPQRPDGHLQLDQGDLAAGQLRHPRQLDGTGHARAGSEGVAGLSGRIIETGPAWHE